MQLSESQTRREPLERHQKNQLIATELIESTTTDFNNQPPLATDSHHLATPEPPLAK
jgi:hypothetical protein